MRRQSLSMIILLMPILEHICIPLKLASNSMTYGSCTPLSAALAANMNSPLSSLSIKPIPALILSKKSALSTLNFTNSGGGLHHLARSLIRAIGIGWVFFNHYWNERPYSMALVGCMMNFS